MREVDSTTRDAIFSRFVKATPSITVVVDADNFDLVDIPASRIVADSMQISYINGVSDEITFGTAAAPDLTAEITNADGLYNRIDFVGKELRVYADVNVTGTPASVTMGRFICDAAEEHGDNIILRALGIITKLDKLYHTGDIQFPITAWNLAVSLCGLCGLQVKSADADDYVQNSSLLIRTEPEDGKYTCRQLLSYVCEIMGVSAQTRAVDGTEKVVLRWYGLAQYDISKANCFALEYEKNAPVLGGVFVASEQYSYSRSLGGDANCVYRVTDNPVVLKMNSGNADVAAVSTAIADNGYGFSAGARVFRPKVGKAEILPNPLIEPLDALYCLNEQGFRAFDLYVCSVTWFPDKNTQLVFAGYKKSDTENPSPFTQKQNTILESLQNQITEEASDISTLQSQMADVRVDYVVENNSDNSWYWRKWNSGIIEMWASHMNVSLGAWSQSGNTGFSWNSGTFNFPVEMVDKKYSMNISKAYDPSSATSSLLIYGSVHNSTTQGGVRVMMPTANTTDVVSTRLDVYVFGRWKAAE